MTDHDPAESGVPSNQEGVGRWRVGQHYGIHVYQGDVPVATFHTTVDAARAVAAVNNAAELESLRRREAAVRALHERYVRPGQVGNFCDHCDEFWPCPTVRALEGETER